MNYNYWREIELLNRCRPRATGLLLRWGVGQPERVVRTEWYKSHIHIRNPQIKRTHIHEDANSINGRKGPVLDSHCKSGVVGIVVFDTKVDSSDLIIKREEDVHQAREGEHR